MPEKTGFHHLMWVISLSYLTLKTSEFHVYFCRKTVSEAPSMVLITLLLFEVFYLLFSHHYFQILQ